MALNKTISHLLGTVTLASVFAANPYTIGFDFDNGFHVEPSFALADSGKGKDGNDDRDDDRDGDHDDGHDDGGDDGHDDGGDDGHDDSGDDGHDDSGDDGHDDSGDDDQDDSGDDDGADDDSSRQSNKKSNGNAGNSGSGGKPVGVTKIETNAAGVEVRYSDGTKEEIENGRYERKNAQNRTVEERPATGADVTRLRSLANSVTIDSVRASGNAGTDGSRPSKVERRGKNIEVRYTNGWKEEIEGGRYELKDPYNRTVVERPATAKDVQRLGAVSN